MRKPIFIILLFCVLCVFSTNDEKNDPLQVIFDTDIGNDIDDVLALQMLINYHKDNNVKILGITISKSNPYAIEFTDAYLRFNGIHDMPLGFAYDGVRTDDGKYLIKTLHSKFEGKYVMRPECTVADGNIPEAYILIRKLLVNKPDNSVILIAVGPMTNLGRLMASKADEISPLNGIELVEKKVKFVATMAGLFSDNWNFPESNARHDLEATKILFSTCPVPIITSGWEVGQHLPYPHQSILKDFGDPAAHPLPVAYFNWRKMPYDRPTWDLTSILDVVEPTIYFDRSESGIIT